MSKPFSKSQRHRKTNQETKSIDAWVNMSRQHYDGDTTEKRNEKATKWERRRSTGWAIYFRLLFQSLRQVKAGEN